MAKLNANEARALWRKMLDDAQHHGRATQVMRYREAIAVVVPADWYAAAVAAIGEPAKQ